VAIDELGNYYVYREYAESDKIISSGAEDILRLSEGENIQYTVAPSDLWSRSQESAKSKADIFRENGLTLIKGNNNREAGWLALAEMLKTIATDEGTESRLKIFNTCQNLIEYIPALQRDNKKPTDCMTEPHEITHLPDALRYFCLQRTQPSKAEDTRSDFDKQLSEFRNKRLNGNKSRKRYY
jgi:phage terminase large subunit